MDEVVTGTDVVSQFLAAAAAGDTDALIATLADDAEMVTPLSSRVVVRGREDLFFALTSCRRISVASDRVDSTVTLSHNLYKGVEGVFEESGALSAPCAVIFNKRWFVGAWRKLSVLSPERFSVGGG